MAYTEAKKNANKRYMDKLARVVIWCSPEEKKLIEQKAQEAGKSVNQYAKDAVLGT